MFTFGIDALVLKRWKFSYHICLRNKRTASTSTNLMNCGAIALHMYEEILWIDDLWWLVMIWDIRFSKAKQC